MSAPAGLPVVGETILGKYRRERAPAEGGMGWVVEATRLQLGDALLPSTWWPRS